MFIIGLTKKHALKLATVLVLVFPATSSASLVSLQTALGTIDIELFDADAPLTVANFLNYVNNGAYNNTFIHRSVPSFVIQGGGYTFNPATQTAYHIFTNVPVVNEFSSAHPNVRGTIGMAKSANNPDSATSEWFINLGDNSANLDYQNGGFTVFGQVSVSGMQVVDVIAALQVVNLGGAFSDLPLVSPYNPTIGWQTTNFVTVSSISAVPIPTTVWLFGSGLLGLIGVARRTKV